MKAPSFFTKCKLYYIIHKIQFILCQIYDFNIKRVHMDCGKSLTVNIEDVPFLISFQKYQIQFIKTTESPRGYPLGPSILEFYSSRWVNSERR